MIDPRLIFYTYTSFYERSSLIREIYMTLSLEEKYVYKYYVYSRRLLREKTCDLIWEYLNVIDEIELAILQELLKDERFKYN